MRFHNTATVLGFAAASVAQTTQPSDAQESAISVGLVSAAKSVAADPSYQSLAAAVSAAVQSSDIPDPAYLSIIDGYATGSVGVDVALLTSAISIPTQAWETNLPSSLQSEWNSFETSFISEAQRVEATPLSITPGAPLPSTLFSSASSSLLVSSSNSSTISSSNSTISSQPSGSSNSTSSSLGTSVPSIVTSSAASSSSSSSSSAAGPTNAAWNAGLGAAVGAVGMAAALL